MKKIVPPEALARRLAELRQQGKIIVHCHGTFDLLHRGHLHQFEQAAREGDILVVSITPDRFVFKGPGRPVFREDVRTEMVAALGLVDYVTLNDASNSVALIHLLRPQVYVKGGSYAEQRHDLSKDLGQEVRAIEAIGGRMHFTHEIPVHSTPLLRNYINPYPPDTLTYLEEIKKQYPLATVTQALERLKNLKVLVLGEVIVDQYNYVQPMESSLKGGIIATKLLDSELFAGGAAACANHLANFCAQVKLVTSLGSQHSYEPLIRNALASNITPAFLFREGMPTIVKIREVDQTYFKKHSETYLFNDQPLTPAEEKALLMLLADRSRYDLVLIADYGHGLITDRIIRQLCSGADWLAVNTQANSANKGFHVVTRYPRANYVNIDSFEARLALRNRFDPFETIAKQLQQALGAEAVIITLGHRGSLICNDRGQQTVPVLSRQVVDPTGAGGAYLALSALCLRAGLPLDLVGFLGNAAGALATTYIGNKTSVSKKMLMAFVNSLLT